MKKKFFNLAVAMSVIASSLAFSSCGDDDDDEDEPKQEQNTNNNTNNDQKDENTKKPVGDPSISVKVAKGDSYQISNTTIGVYNQDLVVEDVTASTITLKLSGNAIEDSKITIGTGSNPSYAVFIDEDFTVKAASLKEAQATPNMVLFICPDAATLASGSTAKDPKINGEAGITMFQKME